MNPMTASLEQLMQAVAQTGLSPVADKVMTPVQPSDAAARALLVVMETSHGKQLVEHLLDVTVRRLDLPLLGLPATEVAIYAAYREGLRDAGVTLLRLAARGRELMERDHGHDD
jgi:hypothetical protein